MKSAERKTRKAPKKISKTYLENAALHYLQRYATSVANLRRVMRRKIDKSCKHYGQAAEDFLPLVEDMIERYIKTGLLNDAVYAQAKSATLRRQGKSRQAIHAKLQVKGLPKTEIDAALTQTDANPDAEFQAALKLTKRKKIGAFRTAPLTDPKAAQKEMAAMGRAGFSYDIARRALAYDGDEF